MEECSSKPRNNATRFLNPWVLHFQKMGLELKCPLCLNFFDEPVLLPCNHLFCKGCIAFAPQLRSACPLCKARFLDQDTRPAPFMDKMVTIYRTLDATFSANLPNLMSSEIKTDFTVAVEQSNVHQSGCPDDCKGENIKMEGVKDNYRRNEDCKMALMNHPDQLSAESPPFGDGKTSDDSSEEYHAHGSQNTSRKRSIVIDGGEKLQLLKNTSPASENEGHLKDFKGQKNSDCNELQLLGRNNFGHNHSVPEFGNSMSSNFESELKSQVAVTSNNMSLVACNDVIVSNVKCAFCQSSNVSEVTGPFLHYMNGCSVVGIEALQPNVIHVHKICVDWAPQVYYEGDNVQNIKPEVARGSKLKCSKCGLKGAALGCYLKSCQKSYHVPCALEVEGCRWDEENFLILCPSHSSVKFPDERSKRRKVTRNQDLPLETNSQGLNNWVSSQDGEKKMMFCGSALSADERNILVKFAKMSGATVSKLWKPDVTHVIASTNENGACIRTYKVLMGILNGTWILKMDWVKACMKHMCPVNEEDYEITLDNYGCVDGPKSGRLRVLNKEPKLFAGLDFYFTSDFPLGYKEDLQNLVIVGGGTVTENEEKLAKAQNCDNLASSKTLVVYNLDSPGGCKVGEEVSILWQRLNEAERIAADVGVGAQVIGHTWLMESISASKLQPFVIC